jgi:exportin-2 (importin alpha re-exporter)
VLETAHTIFKRWRSQFETNALFTEIKYVMETFAPTYLEFFKAIDHQITQNCTTDLLEVLLLLVKIFYSLNCQDLPEFFEDHMAEFMTFFHKYLVYENPSIPVDENEAGPLEKVKTVICEIIDMYASRYEADFKMLPQFVEIIWTLLTNTSIDLRNDILVSKAMSFLTSVVKLERHRGLFEAPGILDSICSQIILPNMTLREIDEELFEDDPIEFIRRDLEGSDNETRRRAAADFVRGLLGMFEKQVTELFSVHIGKCLETYNQSTSQNWKAKDTALYLITSLSAKTVTVQQGATSTNEYIQILPVFASHIIPDFEVPVDGAIHPILKVDAIKYLTIFRNQLNKQQILQVFPHLMNHLGSSNYVVNTWTAHAIERILSMKENNAPIFNGSEIAPFASGILARLFDLIMAGKTPQKLAENDYLMKCVLRVVVCSRADLLPHATLVLDRIKFIIGEISKNPSNPKFNHFTFETLSTVVKFICASQPDLVQNFENALFTPFQEILARDVVGNVFLIRIYSICLSNSFAVAGTSYNKWNPRSIFEHLITTFATSSLGKPRQHSCIGEFVVILFGKRLCCYCSTGTFGCIFGHLSKIAVFSRKRSSWIQSL